MGRRSGRTPLYEYMRDRRESVVENGPAPLEAGAATAVRVPVGFIFIGAAAILVVGIGSYMLGHWRAEQAVRAEYEAATLGAPGLYRPEDPLARPESTVSLPAGTRDVGPAPGEASPRPESPSQAASGGDPRLPGHWYLTLIRSDRDGAERIAELCRAEGLDARVVGGDNARLRVIVLPGFPSQDAEGVEELKAEVYRVGSRIRARHRGESDFQDCYLSLFTG